MNQFIRWLRILRVITQIDFSFCNGPSVTLTGTAHPLSIISIPLDISWKYDTMECRTAPNLRRWFLIYVISSLLLLATCQLVVDCFEFTIQRDSLLAIGINFMTCLAVISISPCLSFFSFIDSTFIYWILTWLPYVKFYSWNNSLKSIEIITNDIFIYRISTFVNRRQNYEK